MSMPERRRKVGVSGTKWDDLFVQMLEVRSSQDSELGLSVNTDKQSTPTLYDSIHYILYAKRRLCPTAARLQFS